MNNSITLDVNLDYDLSYASTYLRVLKGTTNAYNDIPIDINIYINDVKTSPVNILNKDDNLTSFEKDLYLSDGNNEIRVIASDLAGNKKEIVTNINVDCLPSIPEKKDLLTNFIGDDDNNVSLHLGSTDLKYKNKDAGLNKEIIIDTSIIPHYFELKGEAAKYYRISRNDIPKIQGDIIKRPLNIVFDYVEKIYDGNTDITPETRKLELDNGYYLIDNHKEYFDYSNTGLVRGTFERKITSEILATQYDEIGTEYILDKTNIDLTNVYLNLDGYEGYSLFDEMNDKAEIVFNDKLEINDSESNNLNNWFESIELIKNNDKFILKFNYIENSEFKYKVKQNLIIKYNYSNKSDLEYITYKTSDIGYIKVDFKNAFFESKDVTDENQMVTFNDIRFVGDVSNNYQIANYSSVGKILKRTINPHIECLDKIYDGSIITPFKMNDNYYHGFENSIEGDDIYLDNTYEGDKDDETHEFTKSGSTVLIFDDENVGTNKIVNINSLFLEGHDAKNYKLGNVTSNFSASIFKRPIQVIINKLRFIRSNRQWEIDYTISNDIKSDNLTICYNTLDENDIIVYGGIDKNENSIHKNYVNKLDIIKMFFNYPFNSNYQFMNLDTEIKRLNNTSAFLRDEARPAEPDTERTDIEVEIDNTNDISLLAKTLSDGVKTSYFESENKDYKLYSGCKVLVTNINLNPLNNKTKNYILLNSTCETEIEII